jgi:Tol biopolymer transport system component
MKILFTLFILFSFSTIFSQNFYLANHIKLTDSELQFQMPKWSPDGNKILTTVERKTGLYLIHLDNFNELTLVSDEDASGLNYNWRKDNSFSYMVKRNNTFVSQENNTYKIKDAKRQVSDTDTLVYLDIPNTKINARLKNNSKHWTVTRCEGVFYNPKLSPNNKHVAVNEGGNIFIFPANGSNKGINLGLGLVSGWSPDSKYVLAFLDESLDGHSISNSEFFIINIKSGKKVFLTKSKDKIEMWPYFSPDGKKLVYSEEKSGQLFIADINPK